MSVEFDFGLATVVSTYNEFRLHFFREERNDWLRDHLAAQAVQMRDRLQSMNFPAGSHLESQRTKLLYKVFTKLQHLERNDEEHSE